MPAYTTNNKPVSKKLQARVDKEWNKSPFKMSETKLRETIAFGEKEIGEWQSCVKMLKKILKVKYEPK